MSLAPGVRLGSYEIVRQVGAGGMGEVYRARDTNLGREVALKILPDLFTSDADRVGRFKREAHVLAALNHPNIAQIYGLEGNALVMELVDGEDLSAIIARGPLPRADALAIAKQIAEALEAAHQQGIVHRDLKPANIKVRADGTVKVLDFGLAKAIEPADPTGSALMNSPTMTVRATQMGVIVGTAAYMSPEQAAGKAIDKRSDLWALGVVLLEMLTGRQTFDGETVSHVLASVLKDAPDFSSLPGDTPSSIRTLLRRCLEKDRQKRLDSAAAARLEIEDALSGSHDTSAPPRAAAASGAIWKTALPWLVAAAGIAGVWISMRPPPSPAAPVTRSTIELPDGLRIRSRQRAIALSPDGTRLAVVLRDTRNRSQLYLRALDKLELRALAGTDEASDPFWSPDGTALGFFTPRELKRVDLPDGPVRTIAQIEQGRGASWGGGDRAIFSALAPGSATTLTLYEVSMAEPGHAAAIAAVRPANDAQARLPTILPGGAGALFVSNAPGRAWSLHLLDGAGRVRPVAGIDSEVHYVPPGWLAFVRDGLLMVQRFDLRSATLSGSAQVLAEGVSFDDPRGTAHVSFSTAPATSVVYEREPPIPMTQLTWRDGQGRPLGTLGEPGQFDGAVSIAPDGRRGIVGIKPRPSSPAAQLWMIDLATGLRSPFTAGMTAASGAVWSPDGTRVAYRARASLIIRDADAAESSAIVLQTGNDAWGPASWTPDGLAILCGIYQSPRGLDVGLVAADGKRAPQLLVASPAQERSPLISPNGRWLAYLSDESGQNQVYVTAYPALGAKWALTNAGAAEFEWNGANRILYSSGAGQPAFMVTFRPAAGGIDITDRRVAFSRATAADVLPSYSPLLNRYLENIVVLGQRIDSPLVLITNWQAEIRK